MLGNSKSNCPTCNSTRLRRYGIRKCKRFLVQRYKCKDCKKCCCERLDDYLKMQYEDEMIESAVRLFKMGLSTRQIKEKMPELVSNTSIWKWVKKYVANPQFQRNASHRQEIRDKISLTLRGK